MYTRTLTPPNQSFFLFGPRGTGKSSWVKGSFADAVLIDLLHSGTYTELLAAPHRLEDKIQVDTRSRSQRTVIIDEIQRVPELLNEIHRLIETKRFRFVLTGSSARKLRQRGVNLLAGRALLKAMHPLTSRELGKDFDLQHSLRYGQLPRAYAESNPTEFLKTYVSIYLREEVQQEGLTRNLSAFSRFLEAASFSQGSVLNISSVARESHVERKVVEDYFAILEDLMLAVRLPLFAKRAKRTLLQHPKFFFFDAGVFRAIRPKGPLDTPHEIDGLSLETLVLQELRAAIDYREVDAELFFWRTKAKQEVDFVLYGPKTFIAIEVTRASRVTSKDLKSLEVFQSDYPAARPILLYTGTRRDRFGNVTVLPVDLFLKNLPDIVNQDTRKSS